MRLFVGMAGPTSIADYAADLKNWLMDDEYFDSTGENQKLEAIAEQDGSEPAIPLGHGIFRTDSKGLKLF